MTYSFYGKKNFLPKKHTYPDPENLVGTKRLSVPKDGFMWITGQFPDETQYKTTFRH